MAGCWIISSFILQPRVLDFPLKKPWISSITHNPLSLREVISRQFGKDIPYGIIRSVGKTEDISTAGLPKANSYRGRNGRTFPSNGSMLDQRNVPARIGTPSVLHPASSSEEGYAELAKVAVQEYQIFITQISFRCIRLWQERQISNFKLPR